MAEPEPQDEQKRDGMEEVEEAIRKGVLLRMALESLRIDTVLTPVQQVGVLEGIDSLMLVLFAAEKAITPEAHDE